MNEGCRECKDELASSSVVVNAFLLLEGCVGQCGEQIPGCIFSRVCSLSFRVSSQGPSGRWFAGAVPCLLRHTSAREPQSLARVSPWLCSLLLSPHILGVQRKRSGQFYFLMPLPVRTCSSGVRQLGEDPARAGNRGGGLGVRGWRPGFSHGFNCEHLRCLPDPTAHRPPRKYSPHCNLVSCSFPAWAPGGWNRCCVNLWFLSI